MAINKVVYGNDTLIDLTEDTATANDVLNGKTFHLKNGLRATGNASIGDGSLIIKENDTTVETFTANQTTDTTLTLGNLAFRNSTEIDMDLLWTNASPTSGFNAQTVAIDLSSYKFIHVICRWTTSSNPTDDAVQKTSKVGYGDYIYGYGEATNRRRFMRSSNTGVYFSNGRSSNSQADSSSCVPEFIYGIK